MGEHAETKHRIVATAFHFLRAGDPRADEHLEQAAAVALLQGNWPLAEEFLNRALSDAHQNEDLNAQAHHLHGLAQIYGESGRRRQAREAAQASLSFYEQVGDEEGKRLVAIYAATLSMGEGASAEGIATLREAAEAFQGVDDRWQAATLSNLAYAYIQMGLGQEAVEAAQGALDIFTRLGDSRGERVALLNLSAATGMSDYGDLVLQRKLADEVIAKAEESGDLRVMAAGLNHLARVQRRTDDPVGAQRSCEKAIALCQHLGALDAELMNIANLGNALLDQKQFDKAEQAYNEALLRSQESGLARQEAHALELLAKLKYDLGLCEQAIELGKRALTIFERLEDALRIASTQDKLARAYARSGFQEPAAQAYQQSAKYFELAKDWGDAAYAYQLAASYWNCIRQIDVASRCALQGARCALHDDDPGGAANALAEAADSHQDVGELYSELLERFLSDDHPTNFSGFLINFATYCKAQGGSSGKERFKSGIDKCVDALTDTFRPRLANALAIGLEQAQGLLSPSEVDAFAERVADGVEHLHHRIDLGDARTWTIGLRWAKPVIIQLVNVTDEFVGQRLAMSLALILLANKEAIEQVVEQFGGNQESGLIIQIFSRKELEKEGMHVQESTDPNFQCLFSESNVPWKQVQPPIIIIIDDHYDEFSDWSRNPGSKTFLWVLMNVFRVVVGHCSHKDGGFSGFAGKATRFCDLVLKSTPRNQEAA